MFIKKIRKFVMGSALALTALYVSDVSASMYPSSIQDDGSFYISGYYSANMPRSSKYADLFELNFINAKKIPTTDNDKVEYKTGHSGGLELGYAYSGNPRVAVEMGFIDAKFKSLSRVVKDSADVDVLNLKDSTALYGMLNFYYDLVAEMPFCPYIGGGIGLARHKLSSAEPKYSLSYQAKAGVTVPLSPGFRVYGGYKYIGITQGDGFSVLDVSSQTVSLKLPYRSHSFELGVIASM